MNFDYSHKNKKKDHAFKKSAAPFKVKKRSGKKSGFMVLNRIGLLPRNQRKKNTEFNPNYGYGAFRKNMPKCTMHFRTLSVVAP